MKYERINACDLEPRMLLMSSDGTRVISVVKNTGVLMGLTASEG